MCSGVIAWCGFLVVSRLHSSTGCNLPCTGVIDHNKPGCEQPLLGCQLPDKRSHAQLHQLSGAACPAAAAGWLCVQPGRLPVNAAAGAKQPACLLLPVVHCVHKSACIWSAAAAAHDQLPGCCTRTECTVLVQPIRAVWPAATAAAAAATPAASRAVRPAV